MEWEKIRENLLSGLEKAKEAGLVDVEVLPYLDLINALPFFATSSSCYGRIILLDVPTGLKKDSTFLAKWHRKISFDEFWNSLQSVEGKYVWFKMDPLILHVSVKDIEHARRFLEVKTRAGIKRGGIFSIKPERIQIELEGTQKMEVPVKFHGKILITEEYGEILVEEANARMDRNAKQWERFAEEFRKEFSKELNLEP